MTSVLQTQNGRVVAKNHAVYEVLGGCKYYFFFLCLSHSTENISSCLQVFYSPLHIAQRPVKGQSWQSRKVLIFVCLVYNPLPFKKKNLCIYGYLILYSDKSLMCF